MFLCFWESEEDCCSGGFLLGASCIVLFCSLLADKVKGPARSKRVVVECTVCHFPEIRPLKFSKVEFSKRSSPSGVLLAEFSKAEFSKAGSGNPFLESGFWKAGSGKRFLESRFWKAGYGKRVLELGFSKACTLKCVPRNGFLETGSLKRVPRNGFLIAGFVLISGKMTHSDGVR